MTEPSEILQEVKRLIRSTGLRATEARIQTLSLLRSSNSPMTHADVAQRLSDSGVDQATVFRNLNSMADAGLLRKTEVGDRVWRFEVLDPESPDGATHPHFLCVQCGTVKCMNNVSITDESRKAGEDFGEVTEIMFRGRCNDCR
ncbi:MAG: transcriptional repressor [Planctomycetota bacterium]